MGVVLINGIYLAEGAKMSGDRPFVQVIIPGFGVSSGSPLAAAAEIRKGISILREVLFATYSAVCH